MYQRVTTGPGAMLAAALIGLAVSVHAQAQAPAAASGPGLGVLPSTQGGAQGALDAIGAARVPEMPKALDVLIEMQPRDAGLNPVDPAARQGDRPRTATPPGQRAAPTAAAPNPFAPRDAQPGAPQAPAAAPAASAALPELVREAVDLVTTAKQAIDLSKDAAPPADWRPPVAAGLEGAAAGGPGGAVAGAGGGPGAAGAARSGDAGETRFPRLRAFIATLRENRDWIGGTAAALLIAVWGVSAWSSRRGGQGPQAGDDGIVKRLRRRRRRRRPGPDLRRAAPPAAADPAAGTGGG